MSLLEADEEGGTTSAVPCPKRAFSLIHFVGLVMVPEGRKRVVCEGVSLEVGRLCSQSRCRLRRWSIVSSGDRNVQVGKRVREARVRKWERLEAGAGKTILMVLHVAGGLHQTSALPAVVAVPSAHMHARMRTNSSDI